MKKIYFILVGLFFLNTANGQLNCKAIQANAFFITSLPGTLMVDENGLPLPVRIRKERFIYFTTSCKLTPRITKVMYGKTIVKTEVQPSFETSFTAAKISNKKNILLKKGKGKFLWKIYVVENADNPIPDKSIAIFVRGKIGANPFLIAIKEEVELQGHDSY